MNPAPLRVAVLGPGGVGGLIAALLARAGHHVICLAGEATASAIDRNGLRVESAHYGDFTAAVETDTRLRQPVDVLFVTVKQTSLHQALERVPPPILGNALVIPLQNGVEHLGVLRERYPAAEVVAGTIKVEASRTQPGRIHHASPFTHLELAAPLDEFAEQLCQAGLDVALRSNETAMLWDKLAFLAPLALLTTRHHADAGTIRTQRRPELLTVVSEITAVAQAVGAPVTAQSVLALFDRIPAAMKSSMQRDAEAHRPLEVDAIAGAVLRAGAAHHVKTPVTAQLVADVTRLTTPKA